MTIADQFPKRYEPLATEKKWQNEWYQKKLYAFDPKSSKPIYSIDTPPPTVSGKLHIGHVFSYTHTEIISRFRRMMGFNVYYPFGYDDNGLPTELLTEKDSGVRAHQVDRKKFREMCLETGKKYSVMFSDLWKGMGFSCDFDSAYSTISTDSQKISQWSFVDLHQKGKLERRKEPALWCVKCTTSFSQAEIDDDHRAGQFVHIPFLVEGNEPMIVATTRPELLSACVAVFVNPQDEKFISYVGKKAKVPYYEHEVPIIADEKAQLGKGTGVVMCCTFGDSTDILWWRQHRLPLRESISKFGKMTEIAGPLSGLNLNEAKKKIIELLKEKNLILKTVDIPAQDRVVNTHERCGTPVEFILQPQWFIKVVDSKKELIDMGRKVDWHPEYMRHRFENWVENLSWDWAVSRQRSFGVPIPVWYASNDDSVIYVADPKTLPLDPTLSKPPVPCPKGEWIGDPDVLDTWATSSVTPLINARWSLADQRPNFLPMSMRPQAHDIIRTWAFSTIVKSFYHFNDVPWKDAVISGHVKKPDVDVAGQQMAGQEFVKKTKISKSKDGEKYAPEKILERNSADAIRLWSAAASLGSDVMFDENGMGDASKFLNKLWNATRFALMNLEGFTPCFFLEFKDRYPTDRWILSRLNQVWTHYEKSLEAYETHAAKVELDKFFWMDLCDNYIELLKWRCLSSDERLANSAKQTLYEVLFKVISLYAPYAPHITEEIYQLYFRQIEKKESIHLCEFKEAALSPSDDEALKAGKLLIGTVGLIRTYKSKHQLPFRIPMQKLSIYSHPGQSSGLRLVLEDIRQFAQAETVELTETPLSESFEMDFEGIKIQPVITEQAIQQARAKKLASRRRLLDK